MRHIRGKSDLKQKLNFKLELDGPAEREACLQHSCPSSQDMLLWLLMQWQPLGFGATSFLDKRSTVGYSITPNPDPLISVQSGVLMPGAGHLLGCTPTPTGLVNILKRWHVSPWNEGMVFIRHWSQDSWVLHLFLLFWAPTEILCILSAQRCLSVCETPLVVSYLQKDFLLARRILQSPSENCSLEECWFWYKPLNLSRWLCFQQGHRISSHLLRWGDEWIQLSCILCVPSLKWIAEQINSLPLAPASSPNCSFFQSSSEKCWTATASLQVSAEKQAATSLDMYPSCCPVWEGGCQPRCSMGSTEMLFSCTFSLRQGRIGAQHCYRWEEGLAPSELLVSRWCSKSP